MRRHVVDVARRWWRYAPGQTRPRLSLRRSVVVAATATTAVAPDVPCRRGLTGCRGEPAPAVGDRSPRLDGVRRRPVCRRTVRVRDPVARRVVERGSRSTGGGGALAERRAGRVRRDGGYADARTSAAGRPPLTVSGRVGLSGARACRPRRRAPPRGSASASSPRRCPACSAAPRSRARGGPVAW